MALKKQLEALNAKRKALVGSMDALVKACEEESRVFNDEEIKQFDAHKKDVDTVDGQIKRMEDMLRIAGEGAEPIDKELPADSASGTGSAIVVTRQPVISIKERPKGQVFTRFAMALAGSHGNLMQAAEMAKAWRDTTPEVAEILKAAVTVGTTADSAWAGSLVQYQNAAAEFIEFLRPETVIGRIQGFRRVPFNVRIGQETAAASAQWVGEGLPKPVSKGAFTTITVPHTKVAVIVALTEEVVRFTNMLPPGASSEATVQQELRLAIAQFLDQQFVDPTVTASANLRPASITNGATSHGISGTTLDDITDDLVTAMSAMSAANIPMRSRYWLMNPRTMLFLQTLRTAQGLFAFRDEMTQNPPRLLGIPVLTSNSIGATSGSSFIALLEASEILLADDGEVTLDSSREASLQMDDAPSSSASAMVSLWQSNLVGIRAERFIYWARRRAAAVQLITGVTY
jgi:HK97 family phage major capsid protein